MSAAMTADYTRLSIADLEAERRRVSAKLNSGGMPDDAAVQLNERHEALEWRIVTTLARDLSDLAIKVDRLCAALNPSDDPLNTDCIEHAMIKNIMRDIQYLLSLSDLPPATRSS